MTGSEAAMKLTCHLMQCGLLMPIDWLEKNGEGSDLFRAFELAKEALLRYDENEGLKNNAEDKRS